MKIVNAIGNIDDKLIESAEKAAGNRGVCG